MSSPYGVAVALGLLGSVEVAIASTEREDADSWLLNSSGSVGVPSDGSCAKAGATGRPRKGISRSLRSRPRRCASPSRAQPWAERARALPRADKPRGHCALRCSCWSVRFVLAAGGDDHEGDEGEEGDEGDEEDEEVRGRRLVRR